MKVRCDSSTEDSYELGKRPVAPSFLSILPDRAAKAPLPGHDCVYLYSSNYQTIDKLLDKCGSSIALSPDEVDQEARILWQLLGSPAPQDQPKEDNCLRRRLSRTGSKTQQKHESELGMTRATGKTYNNMRLRVRPRSRVHFLSRRSTTDSDSESSDENN